MKRFIRWFLGWRRCVFCGEVKSPRDMSISVVSDDGLRHFCIKCLGERYGDT